MKDGCIFFNQFCKNTSQGFNTQGKGRRAKYRVCIEDDLGEFTNCVVTDKELKNFVLPMPVRPRAAWYDTGHRLGSPRHCGSGSGSGDSIGKNLVA